MKFRIPSIFVALLVLTASVYARSVSFKERGRSQKTEQTIAADPAVTVSICLMSGSIKVRGWEKDEVTARSDAAQIELKRKDTANESARAMKLEVSVVNRADLQRSRDRCQAFSDLELNVPRTASVHVKTRDGNISIADVGMAIAGTQSGDISIIRVSRAVEVGSVGGSISIRDSTGRTSVTSVGGAIEAVNVRPSAPDDAFEAVSVSGDLTLNRVGHAQLNARTVTGNVHLDGPLAQRGRYGFKTMSGDVVLTLPSNASFSLSARISYEGDIITDFPLTLVVEDSGPSTPAPSAPPVSAKPAKAPAAKPAKTTSPTPQSVATPKTPTVPVIVKIKPRLKNVVVDSQVVAPVFTLRRVSAVCGAGDAAISVASFSGTLHLQKMN